MLEKIASMRSIVRLTGCRPPGARWRPGKRDVERLGAQLHGEFLVGQLLAALGERGFDGLLGHVDRGAARLLLVDAQRGHALHQLGDAAGLAEKLRLGVFEFGRRLRLGEGGTCGVDQGVQLVHGEFFEVKGKRAAAENEKRAGALSSASPCAVGAGRHPEDGNLLCGIKQPAWP